jgi:DNA-binding MarR family transcriptional regulator
MSDYPCICVAVRKASRRLTATYDEALASEGITLAQFSLLKNIKRHGPLSLTRLGEIVELDRSTLGRNVRVLERMGLLTLAAGTDQRQAVVALAPDGVETLQRSLPLWEDAQTAIHTKIGAQGAAQLEALLGAL